MVIFFRTALYLSVQQSDVNTLTSLLAVSYFLGILKTLNLLADDSPNGRFDSQVSLSC